MATIQFKIVTPERVVYQDTIDQVTLPTTTGEITVLPNHIALVTLLKPGALVIRKDGGTQLMAVSGGFVEVKHNEVVVLADTAERSDEIDESRAEQARQRAQQLLAESRGKEAVEYVSLAAKLEKELARLHVARRRKHHNSHTVRPQE